jgi:hypothetical protein
MVSSLSAVVRIAPAVKLPHLPRWSVGGGHILLGPYDSPQSHDHHVAQTCGSGDIILDGTEELRFDKATHLLQSCRIRVPENPAWDAALVERVLSAEVVEGRPQAAPTCDFQLAPARSTLMEERGAWLMVTRDASADGLLERVSLAPDLELLWGRDDFYGWLLWRPARYLVSGWTPEAPLSDADAAALGPVLARYVRLLDEPFVERLENGDPAARAALDSVLREAEGLPASPQRDALLAAVASVLATI